MTSLSQPATLEQWHRRLAHCSPLTITEMSKENLVHQEKAFWPWEYLGIPDVLQVTKAFQSISGCPLKWLQSCESVPTAEVTAADAVDFLSEPEAERVRVAELSVRERFAGVGVVGGGVAREANGDSSSKQRLPEEPEALKKPNPQRAGVTSAPVVVGLSKSGKKTAR
jgi:hypothetical protein